MLQSDSQGFLIGEVLDVSKALLDGQKSGLETLGRIDSNLAALVNRRMRSNTVRSFVPEAAPVEPVGRRSSVQVGPFGQPIPRTSSPRSSPASSSSKAVASVSTPALSNRDTRGRFVKRGGLGLDDEKSPGGGSSPDRASSGGDSRIVEAITEALKESSDRMDPMVDAAKEVWEPLGRTWRASFGQSAEKKKEGWFRRILKAITGKKKADDQASAGAAGSGAGLLSGVTAGITSRLAGLASMIPAVLSRVFAPVAAVWAAWEVGQWIGGKFNDWLVASGLQAKLFDWIDGMKAGWSNLMDKLSNAWNEGVKKPALAAWDATTDLLSNAWDSTGSLIKGAKNSFASTASDANNWMAEKTGVDVGASVKAAGAGAKKAANAAGGALGSLIGLHEGDYGSFNRGKAGDSRGQSIDFSGMTVSQIMAAQSLPKNDPRRLFAVGKYQVIPETMRDAVSYLGIKGEEKFSPELQERIFREYLIGAKRPAVANFLSGKSDDVNAAAHELSQEFASVQNPYTMRGYYDGKAGNRASIPVGSIRAALIADRKPVSASVPTISIPTIRDVSLLKSPGPIPDVSFQGLSSSSPQNSVIRISENVSQNVSDRSIAHIATGGMGKI